MNNHNNEYLTDKNSQQTQAENSILPARLMAKGVDYFIIIIVTLFLYPVGALAALIYLTIADHFHKGQSLGKRLFKIRVTTFQGKAPSLRRSFLRNLPLTVPFAFCLIPFWGWALALILAVPFLAFEIYMLTTKKSHLRLGDLMAETTVVANSSFSRNNSPN